MQGHTKTSILGVSISIISHEALLEMIGERLSQRQTCTVVANANPEILIQAYKNTDYREILNSADIIIPDGIGVVMALRFLYGIRIERIAGVDLAQKILALASHHKKTAFLLGATDAANKRAIANITRKTKNLKLYGLGGNFSETEAIERINAFNPDILFVALGSPKQEIFIKNLFHIPYSTFHIPPLIMAIGGAIDFWAHPSLRAPKMLQRIGLEWLWRLIQQPWRLKRIFNAVIVFPFVCFYDFFQQKRAPRA